MRGTAPQPPEAMPGMVPIEVASRAAVRSVLATILSRRTFLQLIGASVGAPGLAVGCSPSTPTPSPTSTSASLDVPFGVWKALRTAVRGSPDHLAARADELVAAKDARALHAFVRDAILTYPPGSPLWRDTVSSVRWGSRATLRGGAGTPREKANLLVDLYKLAGFDAKVVHGRVKVSDDDVARMFLRTPERHFEPAADEATMAAWVAPMTSPERDLRVLDEEGRDSGAIAKEVEKAMDFRLRPDDRWPHGDIDVPIVSVTVDGRERYANVVDPTVAFGDAGTVDEPTAAPPADDLPNVDVGVSLVAADPSVKPIDVLTGSWSLDELVGRQLVIAFLPLENRAALLRRRIDDVRFFRPLVALAGPDLERSVVMDRSVTGATFGVDGDRIDVGDDGEIRINDIAMVVGQAGDSSRVAEVRATADATDYPTVRLRVEPVDASGDVVDGLGPAAFAVAEEDETRAAILREIQPGLDRRALTGPDLILGSWVAEDGTTVRYTLENGTYVGRTTELSASHRRAGFSVGEVVIRVQAQADGSWTGEEEWRLLFFGVPTGEIEWRPTRITIDGEFLTSEPNTGGRMRRAAPYALSFVAPDTGRTGHSVAIRVGRAETTVRYTVPADLSEATDRRIAGIRLSVKVGDLAVTRVIAGTDRPKDLDAEGRAAAVRDCRGAVFGLGHLSFEAAAPTPSAWLDDYLTTRLADEALFAAARANDTAAFDAAIADRLPAIDPAAFLYQAPLGAVERDESLTFETGPRAVFLWSQPGFDDGGRDAVDILPTTRFATLHEDPDVAFRTTLRKTARLAAIEATLHDETTASLLSGARLAGIGQGLILPGTLPSAIPTDVRSAWFDLLVQTPGSYALVPDGGEPMAYWSVQATTGSLLGILANGGGAGRTPAQRQLEEFKRIFQLLSFLDAVLKWGIGPWIDLYEAIGEKVLETAIIIETAGPADDATPDEQARQQDCDAARRIAEGWVPDLDVYTSTAEFELSLVLLVRDGADAPAFDPEEECAKLVT